MCMWVEMDVLWRRCSVLCRMYERGQKVVREAVALVSVLEMWCSSEGMTPIARFLVIFRIRSSRHRRAPLV